MDVLFAQAELYLSKITASHFSTLNTKIANQNVLKRVLIAMLNENMADSNEIPRNYMEAMQFDSENKNSKWYDAIKLEMESMAE